MTKYDSIAFTLNTRIIIFCEGAGLRVTNEDNPKTHFVPFTLRRDIYFEPRPSNIVLPLKLTEITL